MGNCAGILLKYKNQCLLCKRNLEGSLPGVWSVPGGHVEKKEDIYSAAIREFREETGLQILDEIDLISVLKMYGEDRGKFYLYLYEIDYKVTPDLNQAIDGNEHIICKWFVKKKLPQKIEKQLFFIINQIF